VNRILKLFHSTIHHSFKRCDQGVSVYGIALKGEEMKEKKGKCSSEKGNSREMEKFS